MTRARRALGLAVVALSLLALGCATGTGTELKGSGTQAPVDRAAAAQASGPLLALAVELEQQLARANPGADLAVAPLPVAVSLSQLRDGARGTTAEELDRVLHAPADGGADALAAGLASLEQVLGSREGEHRAVTSRTGTVSIDLVQSLWLQKGTAVDQAWLDGLVTTWGAGVRTTDFRSDQETARKAVNRWMADATDGHIDQLAPRGSISPTTRVLAAGAAYLKAPWVTPFADTDTRLGRFHHLDGSESTVPMMRNRELDDARFGRGEGWEAVDLPYLGRSLWMTVILPAPGRFTDVEEALRGEGLPELLASLEPAAVDLSLPKFGFTTDLPLTDALRALGLTDATGPTAADLSGISPEPLWLSSVLHQTYLAVDEQGTEATATAPAPRRTTTTVRTPATTSPRAAGRVPDDGAGSSGSSGSTGSTGVPATTSTTTAASAAVGLGLAGARPVAVVVDRPFLVLVRDRPTGAPLLYGRVLSPKG